MGRPAILIAIAVILSAAQASAAGGAIPTDAVATVRAVLSAPDSLDFGRAKLALDRLVDPATDEDGALRQINGMAATVRRMLATLPPAEAATGMARMQALQTFLYARGWWNEGRPFAYDMSDPLGQKPADQLLSTYFRTRLGNCVSMPILFLILGERLGLDVTLSTAPLHVFVKFTDDAGTTWNLEATSGAGFTRDLWYRRNLPMTDEAIANGVYMKRLSRREALAVMATTVLDHLLSVRHYGEAIAVANLILEAYPADAYALAKKGTAYRGLLKERIVDPYPRIRDIPPRLIPVARDLYRANQDAFAQAEAMGWRMPELK
jgi:regulator of sirC expression with transglutaminase-like and TPR domain